MVTMLGIVLRAQTGKALCFFFRAPSDKQKRLDQLSFLFDEIQVTGLSYCYSNISN
jgi:hypothetical protein